MSAETSYERRKRRVRYNLKQRAKCRVRLCVTRTNKQIYAQLIDDGIGKTLASASSLDKEAKIKHGGNVAAAEAVGTLIAKRAAKAKISNVVFDRGGHIYHGRVKALAEAARKEGLAF